VLGLCSGAAAAEPSQQELVDQVRALQSKVEQLEARQHPAQSQPAQSQPPQSQPAPSQPARAIETRPEDFATGDAATVGSVLSDAERRSNPQAPKLLQPEGFTAGYTHGRFIIQDASGNFTLNPNLQFQARYVFNYRESDAAGNADGGDNNSQDGFEIRRMKFAFDGNLFGPDLTYRFQWAAERNGGTVLLEDAWVRLALSRVFGEGADNLALRVGQFKDPWNHEETTSSKRQLAAERSLLNEAIGGRLSKWVQGVALVWDDGPGNSPFRAEFGFTDGPNTRNTNFTNNGGGLPATFPGEQNPQWGAFGRVEMLARGDWKQYDDFSALGNTQDLLVFGVGASYAEVHRSDILFHTADVQYESGNLGFYASYVGLYNEPNGGIPGSDLNPGVTGDQQRQAGGSAYDWGFLVQAGYMLNPKWEVFGRFDETFVDDNRLPPGASESFPEFTVGVNHYLNGHAAKFTLDGVWLPNGVPSGDFSAAGLLDPDGDEQQFAIRAQFQLLL
jgi:hypothetical protein